MASEINKDGHQNPFQHDGISIYDFEFANETLRPDFSDPENPIYPRVDDIVSRLTTSEKYRLCVLYETAGALNDHFIYDDSSDSIRFYILTKISGSSDEESDTFIFGTRSGITSNAIPGQIGTITELMILLSDKLIPVGDFTDNIPEFAARTFDAKDNAETLAVSELKQHLKVAKECEITGENLDALGVLIAIDYKSTAFALLEFASYADTVDEVEEMLRKANALALAGGFELDIEETRRSIIEPKRQTLSDNLKLLEKIRHMPDFAFSQTQTDAVSLLYDALISAEFLREDTSFVEVYFGHIFPQILETLRQEWVAIRLNEKSNNDIAAMSRKYAQNRQLIAKLANAAGMHEKVNRLIDEMEIKAPLSFAYN